MYVVQNFLLPRTSPPGGGHTAPIPVVTGQPDHIFVASGSFLLAGLASGSSGLSTGVPDASAGQFTTVYLVPTAASSNAVHSDTRAMEPSHIRSEGAAPQIRGSSIGDVFASTDAWEKSFAPASERTERAERIH